MIKFEQFHKALVGVGRIIMMLHDFWLHFSTFETAGPVLGCIFHIFEIRTSTWSLMKSNLAWVRTKLPMLFSTPQGEINYENGVY